MRYPIPDETLSKLSFKEGVKMFAERWPSGRVSSTTFLDETLCRIASPYDSFCKYVSEQPDDCSKEAKELINRPPIFSVAFISVMLNKVALGKDIHIGAVLDLCEWLISYFDGDADTEVDEDLNSAGSRIALFIQAVCKAVENNCPKYSLQQYRERLWKMISCLCRMEKDAVFRADSDPRYCIGVSLEYARWIFNHFKQQERKGDGTELTEVLRLLETRISAEDKTPEEMEMIGRNIDLLYSVDKGWLKEHAGAIFPLGISGSSAIRIEWAAWNSFLSYYCYSVEFYKIFEEQFICAAQQAPFIQAPKNGYSDNSFGELGKYLVFLYMKGELPLDDKKFSLRKFIVEVAPDTSWDTIASIGHHLSLDSSFPEDVIKRCMKLWEVYWEDKEGKGEFSEGRSWSFESWIDCKKFPKDWCLKQCEN